jgi:hypothetical protein
MARAIHTQQTREEERRIYYVRETEEEPNKVCWFYMKFRMRINTSGLFLFLLFYQDY